MQKNVHKTFIELRGDAKKTFYERFLHHPLRGFFLNPLPLFRKTRSLFWGKNPASPQLATFVCVYLHNSFYSIHTYTAKNIYPVPTPVISGFDYSKGAELQH